MEIQFDTTIDDLTEHRLRLFSRSNTYKKNRWVGGVGSFLGVGAVFLILKLFSNAELPLWFPLLLGGVGATGYFIFYPEITRKNIKKYIEKKFKDKLPCTSTCKIEDGYIIYNSVDKEISFEMSALVNIDEDDELVELSFGPRDFVMIPKMAFESQNEIDRFKDLLTSEHAHGV